MNVLSEELGSALAEGGTFETEEEILGRKVRFFSTSWIEDGIKQKSWSYEMDDGPNSTGHLALLSVAREQARRTIEKLNKKRDRSGQYTHHNKWERICKCGHGLGQHSAEALSGGKRDCFACEADGRSDHHHRFVEQKRPKTS